MKYFCGISKKMEKLLNISIVVYEKIPQGLFLLIDVFVREKNVNKIFIIDNSKCRNAKLDLPFVEYIFNNGKNLGYGKAHNIALKKTLEENIPFHLVVNPDVMVDEMVLSKLLEKMSADESVGLLMPKVVSPDGQIQYLCKLLPTPFDLFLRRFCFGCYAKKKQFYFEMHFADYEKEMQVPYLSGCFMFMRTDVLRKVGLFDERFFLYPEDVDLSRRMFLYTKNLYYPSVKIVHQHARDSYKSVRLLSLHIWNMCKYFCKWGWFFDKNRRDINRRILSKYFK